MPVVNGFTIFLYLSLPVTETFKYAPATHTMDTFYCAAPKLLVPKAFASDLYSSLLLTYPM